MSGKKQTVIRFTAALLASKDPGRKKETIPGIVNDAIEAADLIDRKFPDEFPNGRTTVVFGATDGNVSKTFKKP